MNLEAISLLRFLPAGAADMGDVTREEMRQAGAGRWSAPLRRADDMRPALEAPVEDEPATEERAGDLPGYDRVLPLDDGEPDERAPVVMLSFKTG